MSPPYYRNLAPHDPEDYPNIELVKVRGILRPRCPVCGHPMVLVPDRKSNSVWNCRNYRRDENGFRECGLIEGRLNRKKSTLWNCRYEPSPSNKS